MKIVPEEKIVRERKRKIVSSQLLKPNLEIKAGYY